MTRLPYAVATWLAVAWLAATTAAAGTRGEADDLASQVDQILPAGAIPAIFDPTLVSAQEASIIDQAAVLGVVIEGEARAYSLNLLNSHEIVNDRIGAHAFAVVW